MSAWISNTKGCRLVVWLSLVRPAISRLLGRLFFKFQKQRKSTYIFQNNKMGECKTPTVSINQRDGAIFQDIKKLPVSPDTPQLESQLPAPPPYHIFNQSRKLELVFIVSLAAIFSPLSPNIYFPVLGDVSRVSFVEEKDP